MAGCQPSAKQHLEWAQQAVYEQKFDDALVEYRRALDLLEGTESSRATVLRARALKGAADIYYLEKRDVAKAAEVYRELGQTCPRAPETVEGRVRLADILHQNYKDTRGAIRELALALAQNPPESAQLRYRMAKHYFEMGDYQQCELECSTIVESYPSSEYADDALFLRGQALSMMQGRTDEAMRVFQAVYENFQTSSLRGHALFEKGKLQESKGDVEGGIETWIAALKIHPSPLMIQKVIRRARRRLRSTRTAPVGERNDAFGYGHDLPKQRPPPIELLPPSTSIEAAGGSAAEAELERQSASDGVPVAH